MMTREEAIARYEKLYAYMVGDDDAIELDYGEFMELNHYIRSALRPVSREQVEKMWKGEWDSNGPRDIVVYCKQCMMPQDIDTNFCHSCGAAMTDEAVEMVMERLEALYETAE